eukprot:2291731-Pyramimonas_sp.AAC.1
MNVRILGIVRLRAVICGLRLPRRLGTGSRLARRLFVEHIQYGPRGHAGLPDHLLQKPAEDVHQQPSVQRQNKDSGQAAVHAGHSGGPSGQSAQQCPAGPPTSHLPFPSASEANPNVALSYERLPKVLNVCAPADARRSRSPIPDPRRSRPPMTDWRRSRRPITDRRRSRFPSDGVARRGEGDPLHGRRQAVGASDRPRQERPIGERCVQGSHPAGCVDVEKGNTRRTKRELGSQRKRELARRIVEF